MTDSVPEPAPVASVGRHGLQLNIKFALTVALLFPLLVALGFWQLHRADEKRAVLASSKERDDAPAMLISDFLTTAGQDLDGRRVELRGRYLPDRSFLLDNRVRNGHVGYELMTLFRDESGAMVLVDRGWRAAGRTRDILPVFDTPSGDLRLQGSFYVPVDRRGLELYPTAGWPRVVQALDVPAMGRLADEDVFPYLVWLDPDQPGVEQAEHPRVNVSPTRHEAYAAQWFLMAVALLVVFVLGGTNVLELWHKRREARGGNS